MNKKILLSTLIIIFCVNFIYAQEQKIKIYDVNILPVSSKIGMIQSGEIDSLENYSKKMFTQDYSLDWIERFVIDEYKYGFTKENSKVLASLLPVKGPIYTSKASIKANNRAITLLVNEDIIINLIFDEQLNKIISLSIN